MSNKVVEPGCAASKLHSGHVDCLDGWLQRCFFVLVIVIAPLWLDVFAVLITVGSLVGDVWRFVLLFLSTLIF